MQSNNTWNNVPSASQKRSQKETRMNNSVHKQKEQHETEQRKKQEAEQNKKRPAIKTETEEKVEDKFAVLRRSKTDHVNDQGVKFAYTHSKPIKAHRSLHIVHAEDRSSREEITRKSFSFQDSRNSYQYCLEQLLEEFCMPSDVLMQEFENFNKNYQGKIDKRTGRPYNIVARLESSTMEGEDKIWTIDGESYYKKVALFTSKTFRAKVQEYYGKYYLNVKCVNDEINQRCYIVITHA